MYYRQIRNGHLVRQALDKGIDLRPHEFPPVTCQYASKQGIRDRTPAASARFPRRWGGLQALGPGYIGHPVLYELIENPDQRIEFISMHYVDDPVGWHAANTRMQDRASASGVMNLPWGRAGKHAKPSGTREECKAPPVPYTRC